MRFHRLFSLAAAAVFALAGGACATSGVPNLSHAFATRQYVLPSGLRVVVEQDPAATVVGAVWVVEAGHIDDPPDRYGLAHAVEHLVLLTPDAHGPPRWQRLEDLGGFAMNAETAPEETLYRVFGPRSQLDGLARVVVDEMARPLGDASDAVLAAALASERRVLAEEANVRADGVLVDDGPLLARVFPPGDPYGALARLPRGVAARVSVGDLRAFTRDRYQPSRMTLVLSGAIAPDWDARFMSMLPPVLRGDATAPRAPDRRGAFPSSPPASADASLDRRTSKAPWTELRIAWWLPGVRAVDQGPYEILANIVEGSLRSAIGKDELKNATRATAFPVFGQHGSYLMLILRLRDASPAAVEATRDAALDAVTGETYYGNVSALEEAELRAGLGFESLPARTILRARLAQADAGAGIESHLAAIAALTPGQIASLGGQYLTRERAHSMLFVPDATATESPPRDGDRAERTDLALTTGARPAADVPRSLPTRAEVEQAAVAPSLKGVVVTKLSNGLTLMVLRRPGLPYVSLLLGYHSAVTRGDPPGLRVAANFARRQYIGYRLGRDFLWSMILTDDDARTEILAFNSQVDGALGWLADQAWTMSVEFPNPAFQRWVGEREENEQDPEVVAARRYRGALWSGHPNGLSPPAARIRERTKEQLSSWLDRVERPENGVLVVVGDVDPATVVDRAQTTLVGAWAKRRRDVAPLTPPAPPPPARRPPEAGPGPTIITAPVAGRKSATIRFGCMLPPANGERDLVVDGVFTELLRDAVFERLRREQSKSYSPEVEWSPQWGGAVVVEGNLDVASTEASAGVEALKGFLAESDHPWFDAEAVERARWHAGLANAARFPTNKETARALFAAWKLGVAPAALDAVPALLGSVEASDLAAVLRACQASAVVSVIGASVP